MYTLHHIYNQATYLSSFPHREQRDLLRLKKNKHIAPLLEEVDNETNRKAPFIGFEMATGSGKTMLMGATVYYLNKMHAVKNFLIITPHGSSEIYKKTIKNFRKDAAETVWNENVEFNFNLVTGDNYKDTKDLFHNEAEANIFIFNLDKFGANAKQTKKEWEGSIWKDEEGNTISLLDFLSQSELVIITDEAHHAQNRASKNIIKQFKPTVVLEYTATAVEDSSSEEKKNQTIVYKYDIKRFLDDGYGKLCRLLALPGDLRNRGRQPELIDLEKYKLLTFFLVHLLKKKALANDKSYRGVKTIGFVKVKNLIAFSRIVEKYIKEELSTDTENLILVLDKAKTEDVETTNLIVKMFEKDFNSDISHLQKEIEEVAATTILLHNESDQIVRKKFDHIQRNNVEVVVFIDMLNEGIDMPNIYSMVVINDNPTQFKRSIKQIIGRGVRLKNEKRIYDDLADNDLLGQTEKLHIICDKGAAFEDVVLQIQKEFGLNDKTFGMEHGEEQVIENISKSDLLKGLQIPKIKIELKRKPGAAIMEIIENYEKVINDFFEHNSFCREIEEKPLKYWAYQCLR